MLATKPDALSTALLVFPLFLVYQVGIVTGGAGRNGADVVTTLLIRLCEQDLGTYLLLLAALLVGYTVLLRLLHRGGRFDPRSFLPLVLESSLYALCMGSVILLVIRNVVYFMPGLALRNLDPVEVLVVSAGAGLHEELIFRAGLMSALAWLFTGRMGRRGAWFVALGLSAVIFAAAHHVGPLGEPFSGMAFTYRTLAGAYFGVVYQLRGFAIAAWTHALYDVYVLTLGT